MPTAPIAVVSTILLAMMAGVFATFSAFAMRGLDRAGSPVAASAMNGINEQAQRPAFMIMFFGAAVVSIASAVIAIADAASGSGWMVAAAATYLVGCFGITVVRNVPLNNQLARSADPAGDWPSYHRRWTAWNHVRTGASTLAAALTAITLV